MGKSKLRAAILGVTGMVGQQYVRMLENHPWFEVTTLVGSRSAGKLYGEAVEWIDSYEPPARIMNMPVKVAEPESEDVDLVFSSLPTEAAYQLDTKYAARFPTVSDASSYRMEPDVPLLIPEVNPDHLGLLEVQRRKRGWKGSLVTSPNCTATGLVIALKPLHDAYRIRKAVVSTMQALSGAGYPGVPSLRIIDNVIPYIKGEEEKVAAETKKMLGAKSSDAISPDPMGVSVMVHRVATIDGHLESAYIETERPVDVEEAKEVLRDFRGKPQEMKLPTAPERPIIVMEQDDRPQPRLDRMAGSVPGMSTVVGRVRRGLDDHSLRLTLLSHNTIRGAAGNAILIAEMMHELGYLE
ncbi:aspartate-semialdehyde dehydrogenase [Conexivisphaera calida]|uniref:Aspartate-semialdehyde dehydrogenase n=1 Tax=Conexivisphaera calida TaxID=1874277 RepID=A0A4P2VCU1_9ARCH|nr:aspartate-semialdehyde dehydrogenase [Conexivisphaera calida]BBE41947.1 Aspartate-semialdehyde dehydrogenase [Conexivisphaera calida]